MVQLIVAQRIQGRPAIVLRGAFVATLAVALATGCSDSDPTGPIDPTELEFAEELGVDLDAMTRTESGLYLLDEVEGEGVVAEPGHQIEVHYTGWLHDGRIFDASIYYGGSMTFPLGSGNLIQGWEEGIPGMRVGGRRLLVIPPELAYGPDPILGVPWATLVFRIDLLDVVE